MWTLPLSLSPSQVRFPGTTTPPSFPAARWWTSAVTSSWSTLARRRWAATAQSRTPPSAAPSRRRPMRRRHSSKAAPAGGSPPSPTVPYRTRRCPSRKWWWSDWCQIWCVWLLLRKWFWVGFFLSLYVFFKFPVEDFSCLWTWKLPPSSTGTGGFLQEDGCGTSHCGVLGVLARSPVERPMTTLIVSPPSRHGWTGLACASFHNTFTDLSFKWLLLRNDSVERVYCLSGGDHTEVNIFTVGNNSVVWHQEEKNLKGIAYRNQIIWWRFSLRHLICHFCCFPFFNYCYCLIIIMLFSCYCTTSAVCV